MYLCVSVDGPEKGSPDDVRGIRPWHALVSIYVSYAHAAKC